MIKIVKKSLLCILCIAVLFAFAPMMTGVSDVAMAKSKAKNKKQYKLVKTAKYMRCDKKTKKWMTTRIDTFKYNKKGDPVSVDRKGFDYETGKKTGKADKIVFKYTYKKGKKSKMVINRISNSDTSKRTDTYYYNKKGNVTKYVLDSLTELAPLLPGGTQFEKRSVITTFKYNKFNHIINISSKTKYKRWGKDGTVVDEHQGASYMKNVIKHKNNKILSAKLYMKLGKKYELSSNPRETKFDNNGLIKTTFAGAHNCKYAYKKGLVTSVLEKYNGWKTKLILSYTSKKTSVANYRAMINDLTYAGMGGGSFTTIWFGPNMTIVGNY